MDSDDDFHPPNQSQTQRRRNSSRPQTVPHSSTNWSQTGSSQNQMNPGASQGRPSQHFGDNVGASQGRPSQLSSESPGTSQARPNQLSPENQMSQIQEAMTFLLKSLQQLTGQKLEHKDVKRPAEQKPFTECQLCKKVYSSKATLFRHYRSIHKEMNPERYHGGSFNLRETECSICSYIAVNQTALAHHNGTIHMNDNITSNDNKVNVSNTNNESIISNAPVDVKDKMHKCDECACYFEERSRFDEHMKVQHRFEVVCKICNKNFRFKDIDGHVKESHPNVYNKNDKDERKEKVIVEKVMKKKGKRVHVFTCTKCDHKFHSNIEAQRHARSHKKGLKIKATVRNKVSQSEEMITDLTTSNDNVIFTCEDCHVSTGSYDVAVEHSQNHITNALNTQLVTQTCSLCNLKFEPLCFKMHVDLHYENKEMNKESFKYFKYRYQTLLTENWFDSFNVNDVAIKKMISKSIYVQTRSIKMWVLHEGLCTLYKCCQCDNFVDPAAVINHTMNYDTCVKMKSSYPCDICKRKFNNRLTRDKHAKDHNSRESFKIVLFNNDRDKEFNRVLNDPKTREDISNESLNDHVKVIYKCLCGLCFVRKETADEHTKICPGKDPKQACTKCNYLFNTEELVIHLSDHHLNETRISIENITPEVIVIESDDEQVIEIDSSDDDQDNDAFNNIDIEMEPEDTNCIKPEEANSIEPEDANSIEPEDANFIKEEIDYQNLKAHDTKKVESCGMVIKQRDTQAHTLNTENVILEEDEEGHDNPQEIVEGCNDEMTDDSQDTIECENIESETANAAPSIRNEIACVPTDLLLDPFNIINNFWNGVDINVLNRQIATDIETVQMQIEITQNSNSEPFNHIAIKEETPSLLDPTDFTHIRRRPTLRQIEMPSTSRTSQELTIQSLLTDDEESEGNQSNEEIECTMPAPKANNNVSGAASLVEEQIGNIDVQLLNKDSAILHHKDIQNEGSNSTENFINNSTIIENVENVQPESSDNHTDVEFAPAQTNKDSSGNNVDHSFLNRDMDNYDSDDDLFVSSGKYNHNKSHNNELNKEKDMFNGIQTTVTEQICDQDMASKENSLNKSVTGIEEMEHGENNPINGTEICSEIGSETDNNISIKQVTDKENNFASTKRDKPANFGEDTPGGKTKPKDTVASNSVHNHIMEPELSNEGVSCNLISSLDLTTKSNKYLKEYKMKIKSEIDCAEDSLVEVKTEPNDRLEISYNLNDSVFDHAMKDVTNNNCCIC